MKNGDPMFYTYADESGKKLKEYNQYRQYSETLKTYTDFYDSLRPSYSKKNQKNNDDRIRSVKNDRAEKMTVLEEEFRKNQQYRIMHSRELKEYKEKMKTNHSKETVHERLRALYLHRPQPVGAPYVNSEYSITYDANNNVFIMDGDFTNADNVEDQSREVIMEEAENRGKS